MNLSYAKLTLLRPQKERKFATFLIALATATALFLPYIILGDGYFIFFGDFNVQQIPFYQMCHEAVRSGSIGWNWLTDLGSNFVGSYAFYLLGSPFFWITVPFPNFVVPYLMGPLLILKFACAAFTAYIYIRRFVKTPAAAQLGALLYAFSGFSVYNIFFNHFHEAIICFPLLLYALEMLITENKRGVFALAVALCAFVNYFFFFGMVVFCIIYFFVRLFTGDIRIRFGRFVVLIFESVLGVLMSAILLYPALLAIIDNSRVTEFLIGWNGIMYGKEQIYLNIIECFFFPPDLPARPVFFPNADVKWSSLGGWLPLFGMTGVFVLFQNKKGSWLKRIIGICIFMSLVPILNSAFYAFNTAYYARWFYMPILMMCLSTVMLFEEKSVSFATGFKWSAAVTLVIATVIGLFPQKNSDGKIILGLYTQDDDGTYRARFIIAVAIALLSLVLSGLLLTLRRKNQRRFFNTSIALICVISVLYGSIFIACGRAHSYDIKDTMIDDLIEGQVDLDDDTDFRIDTYDGVDNTGMYLGLPSINAFHSVVPASITKFYKLLGVERSVASRPDTELVSIRNLLSVKYLLNRNDGESFVDNGTPRMSGFEYIKTSGGYYVYENTNYVPYGFSYKYYMTEDFAKNYTGDSLGRLMLKAVLLSDEQAKKYSDCLEDISKLEDNTDDYGEQITEDEELSYYEDTRTTTLSLSDEAMTSDCVRLANTSAEEFKIDKKGFTAKVKRDKRSLVFFSVPYDKGWSVTVNGKKATIENVNVGFMAVAVPSGNSTIRFSYETDGLLYGTYITCGAFIVFLVYFIAASIFVRKRGFEMPYPEGERLLKKWRADDLADAIDFDEEEEENKSILDGIDIKIKPEEETLDGGFKINTDIFDDNN